MIYADFITELGKAGLSVRRFATLMGMQPNSISNNKKKGEVPVHLAVIVSLLAEMSYHGLDFEAIFARLEPGRKKPRGAFNPAKPIGTPQDVLEQDK